MSQLTTLQENLELADNYLQKLRGFSDDHEALMVGGALRHLLAAVKELDRRQGVTRFPVGE